MCSRPTERIIADLIAIEGRRTYTGGFLKVLTLTLNHVFDIEVVSKKTEGLKKTKHVFFETFELFFLRPSACFF